MKSLFAVMTLIVAVIIAKVASVHDGLAPTSSSGLAIVNDSCLAVRPICNCQCECNTTINEPVLPVAKGLTFPKPRTACGHKRICLAQGINSTHNETLLPEPNSVTEMRGEWLLAYTSLVLIRMVI